MSAYSNPTIILFPIVEDLEGEVATTAFVVAVFETMALMLASNTQLWAIAQVNNIEVGDGALTVWMKLSDTLLEDNGSNVRETADGAIVLRTFPD